MKNCFIANIFIKTALFLLIILTCKYSFSQSIFTRHYTTQDGLPSNTVYNCHQDLDGYLWFTSDVLTRFDGKNFKTYDKRKGMASQFSILATNDVENNIWVKHYNNNITYSIIKNSRISKLEDSSLMELQEYGSRLSGQLYSKKRKTAYLVGHRSLVCIKKGRKPITSDVRLSYKPSIFETEDGKIFAGDGWDIFSINDSSISPFQKLDVKSRYDFSCYYNKVLYVVLKNKIRAYKYDKSSFKFLKAYKVGKEISAIHADQYGLWLSFSNDRKVVLYRNYDLKSRPIAINIPGYSRHILTSREGDVWIITYNNGLIQIPNPSIINYTVADGLSSESIFALMPLKNNKIWLGYNTGEVNLIRLKDSKVQTLKTLFFKDNFDGYNSIVDIQQNKNNTYILSRSKLSIFNKNGLKTIYNNPKSNKSLAILNDSMVSIGSTNHRILNIRTQKEKRFPIDRTYAQIQDNNNNIWLGSLSGLHYYDYKNDTVSIAQKSLSKSRIISLALKDSFMWVNCIHSHQLYLMKSNALVDSFGYQNSNIPSMYIPEIIADNNSLWLGTVKGIFYADFDYNSLKFSNEYLLNQNDGLISEDIISIKKNDSFIYATSTSGGLTIVPKTSQNQIQYKVSDVSFKNLDADTIVLGDTIKSSYSKKGLEIEFHTAALKYHNEISYRYKLEPFHHEWRTTTNNIIQYTNIPPGQYTFLVDVLDDRVSTTSVLSKIQVYILPTFTQTIFFKTITVLFSIIIMSLLIYISYRRNKKRAAYKIYQNKLLTKTKLDTQKNQLKPHFIFNSLNAIQDYIYNNRNDDAVKLLQNFSVFIRKGLSLVEHDLIIIEQEIVFIKQYLSLEKTKCDNCFEFNVVVDENIIHAHIPSFITQPFIENAVIHGARSANNAMGFIEVNYKLENDDIICSIVDNGIGINESMKHKKAHQSKGVVLSKERIKYFKNAMNIDISINVMDQNAENKNMSGTKVVIVIRNVLNI